MLSHSSFVCSFAKGGNLAALREEVQIESKAGIIGSRVEQSEAAGRHADLRGNDGFGAIYKAKRGLMGGCAGGGAVGP